MAVLDLLLLGLFQVALTSSFSVPLGQPRMRNVLGRTRLASAVDDEKAIQCFIVNTFEVEEEGAEPQIVCTPEPDDYAWFNGLARDEMKETNGESSEGFLECIEGASPRGIPEWECKKNVVEEKAWQWGQVVLNLQCQSLRKGSCLLRLFPSLQAQELMWQEGKHCLPSCFLNL